MMSKAEWYSFTSLALVWDKERLGGRTYSVEENHEDRRCLFKTLIYIYILSEETVQRQQAWIKKIALRGRSHNEAGICVEAIVNEGEAVFRYVLMPDQELNPSGQKHGKRAKRQIAAKTASENPWSSSWFKALGCNWNWNREIAGSTPAQGSLISFFLFGFVFCGPENIVCGAWWILFCFLQGPAVYSFLETFGKPEVYLIHLLTNKLIGVWKLAKPLSSFLSCFWSALVKAGFPSNWLETFTDPLCVELCAHQQAVMSYSTVLHM